VEHSFRKIDDFPFLKCDGLETVTNIGDSADMHSVCRNTGGVADGDGHLSELDTHVGVSHAADESGLEFEVIPADHHAGLGHARLQTPRLDDFIQLRGHGLEPRGESLLGGLGPVVQRNLARNQPLRHTQHDYFFLQLLRARATSELHRSADGTIYA